MAEHRQTILRAVEAALQAADPGEAVRRYCYRDGGTLILGDGEEIDLTAYSRVVVAGAGKASVGLAAAVGELMVDRPTIGAIVTRDGYLASGVRSQPAPPPSIEIAEAGHPLPDERSVAAAEKALGLAHSCRADDLLICLLSGGASALWAAPPNGVSLEDLRALTGALLRSGAPIEVMNVVRKQVSRIAGGRLAAAAGETRLITLALSDVIGAPPDVIGSGPTLPDRSTPAEALEVLHRYRIEPPPSVRRHLERATQTADRATAPEHSAWSHRSFHVIASVHDALAGATNSLAADGYQVEIMDSELRGEAAEVGKRIARRAIEMKSAGASRLALLWGGETTVTVTGQGEGGRNQELAVSAAVELSDHPGITLASVATDGSDGPTRAAGGFADSGTVARAAAHGHEAFAALRSNDSYPYLEAAGDLLVTGPTGTNVNDLVLVLID